MKISIAVEFSQTPGARSTDEGPFSGDEFLKLKLEPAFAAARAKRESLIVDLDGTEGYATSFLEASFGGLARLYPIKDVQDTVEIVSTDEPFLVDEIAKYIRQARDQ